MVSLLLYPDFAICHLFLYVMRTSLVAWLLRQCHARHTCCNLLAACARSSGTSCAACSQPAALSVELTSFPLDVTTAPSAAPSPAPRGHPPGTRRGHIRRDNPPPAQIACFAADCDFKSPQYSLNVPQSAAPGPAPRRWPPGGQRAGTQPAAIETLTQPPPPL